MFDLVNGELFYLHSSLNIYIYIYIYALRSANITTVGTLVERYSSLFRHKGAAHGLT
jgi:hypothetical protein